MLKFIYLLLLVGYWNQFVIVQSDPTKRLPLYNKLVYQDEWRIWSVALTHLSVALIEDRDAGRHGSRRGRAANIFAVDLKSKKKSVIKTFGKSIRWLTILWSSSGVHNLCNAYISLLVREQVQVERKKFFKLFKVIMFFLVFSVLTKCSKKLLVKSISTNNFAKKCAITSNRLFLGMSNV